MTSETKKMRVIPVHPMEWEIGEVTDSVGAVDVDNMDYPVECRWCRRIHDAAQVTIVQRYADCSVWRCPYCDNLVDDRPRAWGGSAFPVRGGGPMTSEAECTCTLTDEKYWTRYLGVTEPGSMVEPDPDCPVHFPEGAPCEE